MRFSLCKISERSPNPSTNIVTPRTILPATREIFSLGGGENGALVELESSCMKWDYRIMGGGLAGRHSPPRQRALPFFPESAPSFLYTRLASAAVDAFFFIFAHYSIEALYAIDNCRLKLWLRALYGEFFPWPVSSQ